MHLYTHILPSSLWLLALWEEVAEPLPGRPRRGGSSVREERWRYLKRMPPPSPVSWHSVQCRRELHSHRVLCTPPPRPVPPPYTVFCLVERVWFLLGSQQGWPSAQTFLFMELRLCVPGSKASCGPWRFPVLLTMMVPSPQIRLQMSLGWPESPRGPVGQSTVGLFHGAPFFSAGDPRNQSCQSY